MSDFKAVAQAVVQGAGQLHKAKPELMTGFMGLHKAAMAPGALDEKTKEMMALAIGVAKLCDGCIASHLQKLVSLGLTADELNELLGVAILMGGGPSLVYATHALEAFQQLTA